MHSQVLHVNLSTRRKDAAVSRLQTARAMPGSLARLTASGLRCTGQKTSLSSHEARPANAVADAAADAPVAPPPAPQSIHDVNNGRILGFGPDLAEDHPGYHDPEYKARRHWISQVASTHVIGSPIPEIEYLPEEIQTWRTVMHKLEHLIPKYGCREFIESYNQFNFSPDRVPQLQELHERLHEATGWNVRPVAGLMHPREFLNGLAFKYFHSTQYMRHHGNPMYTPEPDVCHEVLGHMPMLVNKDFCALAEAIGKASLGASEKEIWHLSKVYWYTVEFGVVLQEGDIKAFGAGILSSFGELEWMGSGQAAVNPLNPWVPLPKMSYKDGFQKHYYSLNSFEQGAALLKEFSADMVRKRNAVAAS